MSCKWKTYSPVIVGRGLRKTWFPQTHFSRRKVNFLAITRFLTTTREALTSNHSLTATANTTKKPEARVCLFFYMWCEYWCTQTLISILPLAAPATQAQLLYVSLYCVCHVSSDAGHKVCSDWPWTKCSTARLNRLYGDSSPDMDQAQIQHFNSALPP